MQSPHRMSCAPRSPARGRDADPHRLAALATALLLPGLMALWVAAWRAGQAPTTARLPAVVTRLVFIAPPAPPPAAAAPASARSTTQPEPRAGRTRRGAQPLPRTTDIAPRDPRMSDDPNPIPAAAMPAGTLDYGNLLGRTAAPVAIADTLPWERAASRPDAAPDRFRMRRQITPADVVRGFSQLVGLWPPGYTDSPCPTLRRTIDSLSQAPSLSTREHALLQDAVLARSRYCA